MGFFGIALIWTLVKRSNDHLTVAWMGDNKQLRKLPLLGIQVSHYQKMG